MPFWNIHYCVNDNVYNIGISFDKHFFIYNKSSEIFISDFICFRSHY
jgi:hypothetical protein